MELEYVNGQTFLDEEEKEGLLIPTITNRNELDEFEQQNIEQAVLWSIKRSFRPETIFTTTFIQLVHKQMYGKVWSWAGEFRKTDKNIGIDKWQIQTELKYLLDNAQYWLSNFTYSPDEFSIRFKHRLVAIHCFPNGNGRHSRLIADIIIEKVFKQPIFTWGAANLVKKGDQRAAYLSAIKAGDNGNLDPLLKFARS